MGGVWLDPFSGFAAWPNQTLINLRIQGRRAAQCNAECQSSFPTRSLSGARFSASLRTCALIYSFIKLCSICRAALLWKRKRRRTVNISKWMCIILIDALQSIEMRPPPSGESAQSSLTMSRLHISAFQIQNFKPDPNSPLP